MICAIFQTEVLTATPNATYAIQLKEGNWRLHATGEIVDRSIFMAALQNVKQINIRGTSWLDFTQAVYVCFSNVFWCGTRE